MRKLSVSLTGTVAALLLVATSAAAAGTTIESFSATVGPTTISVSGTASFVDEPMVVGTDAPEAVNQGKVPGTDITTIEISRPNPTANAIRFTMNVANQPPELNGIPLVPYFAWDFFVDTPTGQTLQFLLLANRATGESPDTDPDFVLWTCDPDAPPPNCNETARVTGAFTPTAVEVTVPANTIGAAPGAVISGSGTNNVRVSPGIGTPVATGVTNLLLESLTQTEAYTVPGPTVRVGVAPAGTAPEAVELTKAGSFKTDGTFSATLPKPEPGDHVVAAEVCYTDTDCALTSTDVTV